jgi:hypothetical protein
VERSTRAAARSIEPGPIEIAGSIEPGPIEIEPGPIEIDQLNLAPLKIDPTWADWS